MVPHQQGLGDSSCSPSCSELWLDSHSSPSLLRLIKQLQVQAHHDLPRGDLVQEETFCNWSLGALVLLDVCHTDLCPAQKVWNAETQRAQERGARACRRTSASTHTQQKRKQAFGPAPAVHFNRAKLHRRGFSQTMSNSSSIKTKQAHEWKNPLWNSQLPHFRDFSFYDVSIRPKFSVKPECEPAGGDRAK